MEIAKQFVDLAKKGAEEGWSAEKIAKKSQKLFESMYGDTDTQIDTKEIKTRMSRFGETIYNNVSEALSKSKETDIIVMAGGLYKIFSSREECNKYLLNVWDVRPSRCKEEKPDVIPPWIEHFQIIPSDKTQHFVIVCTDTEKAELDQLKIRLIQHFKQLKKENIICVPLAENEVGVVLESMHGTLGDSHLQLSQFIKSISDKELRQKISCLEAKRDEVTEKTYVDMPIIREILKDDYTRQELVGPSQIVYINIYNNSNNTTNTTNIGLPKIDPKKDSKRKLKKWIRKNPPEKTTVAKYHILVIKAGFDIDTTKLDKIMKSMNYEKKRYTSGIRWILSESDSDESDPDGHR